MKIPQYPSVKFFFVERWKSFMGQMILEFVRNVGDLRETFKNEKERKEKFEYHMLM